MFGNLLVLIFSLALLHKTQAVNDDHCETGLTPVTRLTDPADLPATCAVNDVCTGTDVSCGDGTCILVGQWCDGGTSECANLADESTCVANSGETCQNCPAPPAAVGCQPVFWEPPISADNENHIVISDCAHFPQTTFPSDTTVATTTTVVYTFLEGVIPSFCKFEVTVPAITCDPVVNNCPNMNIHVTADPGADSAQADFTQISTEAGASVVESNCAPNSQFFPVGCTRCTYKVEKDDGTGTTSYCIFYICVKRDPASVSPINLECNDPIVVAVDPPTSTVSLETQLQAILDQARDANGEIASIDTNVPVDYNFPIGTTQFDVVFYDKDSNGVSCAIPITVSYPVDNTPPTISNCPSGVTVCHAEGELQAKGAWTQPEATDDYLKSYSCTHDPNNYLRVPTTEPATTTVTCTAVDYADQVTVCQFIVAFEVDTLAPVISNCDNFTEYTTEASGTSLVVNYPTPTVTDNCDAYQETVTGGNTGSSFLVPSINRITYAVVDDAGNTAECSFTVEVREDEIPSFTNCPPSMTFNTTDGTTSALVSWNAPEVTDDNQLDADNVQISVIPGITTVLESDEDISETLEKGEYTVTYSYTDVNLQKGVCSFVVFVQDAEAPVFNNCPPDMERTLNSTDTTVIVGWVTPTAVDNDDNDVEVEIQTTQYESGRPYATGEYTIIYRATDESNNVGYCSFLLTVNAYDTGNFWIGCPNDLTVNTDPGLAYSTVAWNAPQLRVGIDQPTIRQSFPEGSSLSIGDTRVEYTAFDKAGNSDACVFTVTVLDREPPVIISCPGANAVYVVPGRTLVPVYWLDPTTSDNSGSTVTLNANPFGPGTEFGMGTSQVYYSAVDSSGNSVTGCTFQVQVIESAASFTVSGSARFSSIRGSSSNSAISQASNLAEDLDRLLRMNTPISNIIAGVQVGTPSQLSGGDLLVPINLYLHQCRAAYLHIRDSLTQNLEGNQRDSFDTDNVISQETFQLDTKEFLISLLKMDQDLNLPVNDRLLIYNGDYSNPRTSAYQYLEDRVCDTMDQLFSSFTGYCGCAVWQFSPGSIIADVIIIFNDGSSITQSALYDQIGNSINTGDNGLNNLILQDFPQTTVTEVCPDSYCQNGGSCQPNPSTYLSQCSCPPGYAGTQCQTDIGAPPPVEPTEEPSGFEFTTEAIIGIVVGTVGGLLLLIIFFACICVFCLRPAPQPKPQPIINQPGEPVYAVQPPRPQNVQIRDVVERPPTQRPVPVRVPAPYPVPVPQRIPVPVPRPVPRPFPVPIRSPVPVPVQVPVPVRQPFPRPFPVAIPQRVGVPRPVPIPTPVPFAVPNPVSVPQPYAVPIREQVPVYQFGNASGGLNGLNGLNLASRQPFGPGNGIGFGSRLGPNLNGLNNGGFNGGFNGGLNNGGFNNTGF